MKRSSFFKASAPAGASVAAAAEQPRSSRQSIRGRISAPIPIPDPYGMPKEPSLPPAPVTAPATVPAALPANSATVLSSPNQDPPIVEEPGEEEEADKGKEDEEDKEDADEDQDKDDKEPRPPVSRMSPDSSIDNSEAADNGEPTSSPEPRMARTPESVVHLSEPITTPLAQTAEAVRDAVPVSAPQPKPAQQQQQQQQQPPAPLRQAAAPPMRPMPMRDSAASALSSAAGAPSYNSSSSRAASGSPLSAQQQQQQQQQRKKSSLRNTLHKFFGRRKKSDSQFLTPSPRTSAGSGARSGPGVAATTTGVPAAVQGGGGGPTAGPGQGHETGPQHRSVRSDPTILGRPRGIEAKRSASLLITDYDRALRAHAADTDSERTSFQDDPGQAGAPPAAARWHRPTASSSSHRLFPTPPARRRGGGVVGGGGGSSSSNHNHSNPDVLGGGEWAGLSPRPASAHAHGRGGFGGSMGDAVGAGDGGGRLGVARALSIITTAGTAATTTTIRRPFRAVRDVDDPNEIGRALTLDADGPDGVASKRRSRSLSGLHEMAQEQARARRRSDEIRYWRESYDPAFLSPLSSAMNEEEEGGEDDDDEDRAMEDAPRDEIPFRLGGNDGNDNDDDADDDDDDDDDDRDIFRDCDDTSGAGGRAASLLQSYPESPITPRDPLDGDGDGDGQSQQLPRSPPPQPFAFGHLSRLDALSAPLLSPLPPPPQPVSGPEPVPVLGPAPGAGADAGLPARVGGLESRMHRVERVVDQLCHAVPGFQTPLLASPAPAAKTTTAADGGEPALPPIPAIYQAQAAAASQTAALTTSGRGPAAQAGHSAASSLASHRSFSDTPTYVGSLHPPSSSSRDGTSSSSAAGGDSKTAAAAAASSSSSHELAAELAAALASERAVRQDLEAQVKKLNERVNALSTTMYAMLREPREPRGGVRQRHSREPLSAKASSASLRAQQQQQQQGAAAAAAKAAAKAAALSPSLPAHADAEMGSGPDTETETETDGFQTPTGAAAAAAAALRLNDSHDSAMSGSSYGSSAAADDWDEAKRRKRAARTLSLGQLTHSKSTVQA